MVNNAGIFLGGPIEWQPLDNFRRTADVNLWGMIDVTKTFLPLVKIAKGRVVNFSSLAGLFTGGPGLGEGEGGIQDVRKCMGVCKELGEEGEGGREEARKEGRKEKEGEKEQGKEGEKQGKEE